jgi:type IX secretion system PorP/SprF family membrane protein
MKKYILFILLGLSYEALAQWQSLFTLHREQTALLNPAMPSTNYIVSDFNNMVSMTYRYQWVSIPEAPVTQVLNWESMPVGKNILIGAFLMNDKTGQIGSTSFQARFAYKLLLDERDNRFISIGFNTGATRSFARLNQYDSNIQDKRRILPDLSMGAFYNEGNRFYAGISAIEMLGSSYQLENLNKQALSFKQLRHLYAIAGYYINAPFFGNDVAVLEPNIWFRYIPATKTTASVTSFDLNLRAKISQSFWTGVGLTSSSFDALGKTLTIEVGSVLSENIGLSNGQVKIGFGFMVPMGQYWSALGTGGDVHLSYSWAK